MSKCTKCGNEILTGDIHWEMGLCNNCYNELYKDHKTHISLDKIWLNIAQQFRDENEKLQDKVADLEAKLAESEKKHLLDEKEWQDYCAFKHIEPEIRGCLDREREYEKQLAEYEAIKNKYKTIFLDRFVDAKVEDARIWKEEYDKLQQQLAEKEKEIEKLNAMINTLPAHDKELKEIHNQDKITFAVEQLKKVKAELVNKVSPVNLSYTDYVQEVFSKLNNQIEELKKEMK